MKSVAGMSISVAVIRDIVKILEQVKMKEKKKAGGFVAEIL